MATDQERISALEQFAVDMATAAGAGWLDTKISALVVELGRATGERQAIIAQVIATFVNARQQLANPATTQPQQAAPPTPAAPARPTQPQVDQQEVMRLNNSLFERYDREVGISRSYTAVVTGAGYAGLLAIWGGLRDHLDKGALLWSAALIGVSLVSFISWEMVKAYLSQIGAETFYQVVTDKFWTADFERASGAAHYAHNEKVRAANQLQPISFWLSTVTGFLAAGILAWAAVVAATGLKLVTG